MRYNSTRNRHLTIEGHQAVIHGLAPDGGLYVPENTNLSLSLNDLENLSYQETAEKIFSLYFDDYTEEEIRSCVRGAYGNHFDNPEIVPLKKVNDAWFMELWHGPTSAFKDIALTILPYLLTTAYQKEKLNDTIAILTATSGDTGKAALSGFRDVPHTAITVFYPVDGVSPIQKRQMCTSRGNNVEVIAVKGNFDDCQRMVKKAYDDPEVLHACHHVTLSSANSINIGRLIPQSVYYFTSYEKLARSGVIHSKDLVNFVVPTGNFGDVLAGYLAKKAGLPIGRLIVASNTNNVLTDFLNTGIYSTHRPFHCTISPSMDILISSNLERLLYFASDGNDELVRTLMKQLSKHGSYQIPDSLLHAIRKDFSGYWCSEENCCKEIHNLFEKEHVLIDPHTAVAYHALHEYQKETGDQTPSVVLSTASPFKFARNVLACISEQVPDDDFACMDLLSSKSGMPIPKGLAELKSLPVRFTETIEVKDGMSRIAEKVRSLSHD